MRICFTILSILIINSYCIRILPNDGCPFCWTKTCPYCWYNEEKNKYASKVQRKIYLKKPDGSLHLAKSIDYRKIRKFNRKKSHWFIEVCRFVDDLNQSAINKFNIQYKGFDSDYDLRQLIKPTKLTEKQYVSEPTNAGDYLHVAGHNNYDDDFNYVALYD